MKLPLDAARRGWPILLVIAAAAAFFLARPDNGEAAPTPEIAQRSFTPEEQAAIQAMVRQYILDNPEIIPEAITRLQEREVAKLLESNREEIETPYEGAWAGAEDGDVTLVEFYDYACPYCRAAHQDVQRLLKEDEKLKVVYRDFPVLSAASEEAAMASLSAAAQGRYRAFHDRLFSAPGRLSHEKIVETVRAAGLNELKTARDLQSKAYSAEIQKNQELARALGLTGTPAYVVGDRILVGAVGYDELKRAIAEARAEQG